MTSLEEELKILDDCEHSDVRDGFCINCGMRLGYTELGKTTEVWVVEVGEDCEGGSIARIFNDFLLEKAIRFIHENYEVENKRIINLDWR